MRRCQPPCPSVSSLRGRQRQSCFTHLRIRGHQLIVRLTRKANSGLRRLWSGRVQWWAPRAQLLGLFLPPSPVSAPGQMNDGRNSSLCPDTRHCLHSFELLGLIIIIIVHYWGDRMVGAELTERLHLGNVSFEIGQYHQCIPSEPCVGRQEQGDTGRWKSSKKRSCLIKVRLVVCLN